MNWKNSHQQRNNLVNGNLLTDSDNILNWWKRQIEKYTLKPSSFEVEITSGKLKRFKLLGYDVLVELIQTSGKTYSAIHRLVVFGVEKN
jgi:hypothetical protein